MVVFATFTSDDLKAVLLQRPYYDPKALSIGGGTCGGSTQLVGAENAEKVWRFLVGKGLSPEQAAGVMGNLQAESGFNPKRVQGTRTPGGDSDTMNIDGKTGYGIAQWTNKGRQQNLQDFADKAGQPVSDLGTQLDFLYMESTTGSRRGTWDNQTKQTDVRAATYAWEDNYENPKSAHAENRVQFANDNLAQFGSVGGSSDTRAVVCAGQVVGGLSLPVDRSYYDAHTGNFTKPHHDYPADDISMPSGTNVYSMTAGKVVTASRGDCGIGITIQAPDGTNFTYCHGQDGGTVPGAQVGDTVTAGQLIMHSDNTGHTTGPHLHVQLTTPDGVKRCPQTLMTGIANGSPPAFNTLPSSGCTN
jgi:hypothetical protein